MLKNLLSVLLLFLTISAFAQVPVYRYAGRIAGSATEYGEFIQCDAAGFVYVVGRFGDGCDFDPGTGVTSLNAVGTTDGYIAKYTAAGNLIWVTTLSGTGTKRPMGIELGNDGNIYVYGDFTQTLDVVANGTTSVTSVAGTDAFLTVLDTSGSVLNLYSFGGPNTDYVESVAFDSNNNFYICGEFGSDSLVLSPQVTLYNTNPTGFSYDCYIAKFDPNGTIEWAINLQGSSSDYLKDITVDDLNRVVVGGYFSTSLQIGSTILTSLGLADCFIARFSDAGILDNAWSFGGTGTDNLLSIATYNNNIYSTGTFSGTADIAPGNDTMFVTTHGGTDIFVNSISSTGSIIWGGCMGGSGADNSHTLRLNSNGDVYITGSFLDSADFDPGAVMNYYQAVGGRDGFIVRLDNSGSFSWAMRIGSPETDYTRGLSFSPSGEIWTTGYYLNSTLYPNPQGLGNALTNLGGNDAYFARYGECSYPLITTQPVIAGACAGSNADFSIAATGTNISVQWQEGTNGGTIWNNITDGGVYSGSTTPNLTLSGVGTNMNNLFYRAVVTADCGLSTTSGVGILFVGTVDTTVTLNSGTLTAAMGAAAYQWLDCNNSYAEVFGATSQSYTPVWNGSYALEITKNGCIDTSSCYTITTAGINDIDIKNDLQLFPVPAQNQLHLVMKMDADYEVTVLDITGRSVLMQSKQFRHEIILDVSSLDAGMYHLGISKNGGAVVLAPFIKQ